MRYVLITKQGRVMQFYVQEMAEMYKLRLGGVLLTESVQQKEFA